MENLEQLFLKYQRKFGKCYKLEDRWWANKTITWEEAVVRAWRSRLCSGEMYDHQRRVGAKKLEIGLQKALSSPLCSPASLQSFFDVYKWIKPITDDTERIGPVTAYDVSRRIASWLGYSPEEVFLHGGTAKGARSLGIRGSRVPVSAFPEVLQKLSPEHIENFLCINKDKLWEL